jgi:hypothetical protein
MRTTKQKLRKGSTLIELLVVLIISLFSISLIKPLMEVNHLFIIDAHIFASMMKSISSNESISISFQNQHLNTFYPHHTFSHSYTKHLKRVEIIFYIGRGYYAIKTSP